MLKFCVIHLRFVKNNLKSS